MQDRNGIARPAKSSSSSPMKNMSSARATTPNAHFTSPLVIGAIWDGLEKLGVKDKPEVLEPAMGVGHFLGLMPESLRRRPPHRRGAGFHHGADRQKTLSRLERYSPRVLKKHQLPDNYFDAVIGNVPFGNYPVHDPSMKAQASPALSMIISSPNPWRKSARAASWRLSPAATRWTSRIAPSASIWQNRPT